VTYTVHLKLIHVHQGHHVIVKVTPAKITCAQLICLLFKGNIVIPGAARAGPEARPEARPARGHSKLACVCASARTV